MSNWRWGSVRLLLFPFFALILLSACTTSPSPPLDSPTTRASTPTLGPARTLPETPIAAPVASSPAATGTATSSLATQAAPSPSPTSRPPFDPDAWQTLPVIPELSPNAVAILRAGLARGNDPRAFSKIGDCESRTTWFLDHYDLGQKYYSLGPYEEELAPVVEYYAGSFNRLSQAAKPGFTAASLLSTLWSDRQACEKGESPLACEYRLQNPAVAFVLLGTNDAVNPDTFEGHMRKILDVTLAEGVLPILGTKADNIEGDHQINQTIARLAYEYDVPLWNYWLAVQDLPGHGLQPDGSHLTFAAPFFDESQAMRNAWPVRNLNALQILQEVMEASGQ